MHIKSILIILLILIQLVFAEGGSKEQAKGTAVVADSSAFSVAYWNPGMLAFKRDLSMSLNAEKHHLGRPDGSFGIENGVGNRMGIGGAVFFIDDFILYYAGLGYRFSKADGVGISLSVSYDMIEEYQSPVALDLGWFRFWSEKWQSGLQIRNMGSDSRAKSVEAGLTHRNLLLSKPASVSLSIVSSQISDTLSVFDKDGYVLKGKFGFEWRAVPNGDLRFGINGKKPVVGWGYDFNVRDKVISVDYASPLSVSLRVRL